MAQKPVVGGLGLHEPGPHVVGDAVAGHVLVGAGHAVAGDGAEHDAGVHLAAGLVAEPAPLEAPRAHGLDDRVGAGHQVEEHRPALLGAQVEGDRALAPADVEVHQRGALDDRPRHLADVVARGRLDLDHVGAEVGQGGRDGAGPEHRALDDADAVQGGGGGHAVVSADLRADDDGTDLTAPSETERQYPTSRACDEDHNAPNVAILLRTCQGDRTPLSARAARSRPVARGPPTNPHRADARPVARALGGTPACPGWTPPPKLHPHARSRHSPSSWPGDPRRRHRRHRPRRRCRSAGGRDELASPARRARTLDEARPTIPAVDDLSPT